MKDQNSEVVFCKLCVVFESVVESKECEGHRKDRENKSRILFCSRLAAAENRLQKPLKRAVDSQACATAAQDRCSDP
jgi:hypothetical protein